MLPLLLSSYLRVSVLERWHVRWSWREVRSRETPNMHTYTYVLASYMGDRRWSRGSRSDKEVLSGLSRVLSLSPSRNTRQMELILGD